MPEWTMQTNLTKCSKSKNPDVDDQGLTRSRQMLSDKVILYPKMLRKFVESMLLGKQKAVDARQGGRKQVVLVRLIEPLEKRKTHMISILK